MGINPIEYHPWEGERTDHLSRVLTIGWGVVSKRFKSNKFKLFMILIVFLVHGLPILVFIPQQHDYISMEAMYSYFISGLFVLITMLLAALVTSDLISEDLRDNSFVLYFSRPLKTWDYLAGKAWGAFVVMASFCLVPPMIFVVGMLLTQTTTNYDDSLNAVMSTFAAGVLSTVIFIPYGMMISALTKRRSFAIIGTFASFFVMTLLSGIFSIFNVNWLLASPLNLLTLSLNKIFDMPIYIDISDNNYYLAMVLLFVLPTLFVYYIVNRKAVGR